MHLLVTGANGFIGRALVRRLLASWPALDTLTLLDLAVDAPDDARVRALPGDLCDARLRARAFAQSVDVVFHLASLPGGATVKNPTLGYQVNVGASAALMEEARGSAAVAPVFVFASSIAALGAPLPAVVDDDAPAHPTSSYGAHKQIGEILLEDATRRGAIDGRAPRLPGIVMRPPAPAGLLSAFMSDLIRYTAEGRRYTCPVSPQAPVWIMSVPRVVDNLVHAARMPAPPAGAPRAWTLPALRVSMAELVAAVGAHGGRDVTALVDYAPDAALEAAFAAYPPLSVPSATALGFSDDGDAVALVARALAADKELLLNA
ncbi:MAG: NAD-dependent epimerase/dehydratase family protein [Pseudoxanthomonas sp.]